MTSRTVLLTGASAGLGRAMTLALLGAGHQVAALARNAATMDELLRDADAAGNTGRLVPVLADVSSAAACERAVGAALERLGTIDALVNNAGAMVAPAVDERFYERGIAEWDEILRTNLTAPFLLARLLVPAMVERGWGRVVNTVSSSATMRRRGFTPYGPSKAALQAATSAWAAELAGTGVTVNAIMPGGAADTRRVSAEERARERTLLPPEIMGPPIVWLLSPAADDCSGMRLVARDWDSARSEDENRRAALGPAWKE
jgi:3-oxoacyl-[acyl-carrier protein] reductase